VEFSGRWEKRTKNREVGKKPKNIREVGSPKLGRWEKNSEVRKRQKN
jgi:hypothetical protein